MSARGDLVLACKIAAARAWQALGMAGLVGLALLFGATGVIGTHVLRPAAAPVAQAPSQLPVELPVVSPLPLPAVDEVPLLLTQIEQAAITQGLGWPQAQYRLVPAGPELPASLELRLAFKAPYLAVRRFVAVVLRDVPGAALREFAVSRAGSDAAQVEAKLAITVFLAGDVGMDVRVEAAR